MCGIAGFWTARPQGAETASSIGTAMATRLAHRGPDGAGVWVDADGSVALAHRRLAIVDLSAAGHQPMSSASNRYELIFNGEIYNHMALRADLQGCTWRGHSDTETLLAGFEQWGIEKTLQKAVGMFAIALWDRRLRRLTLARDRMGEKPLYYGTRNGLLLFASELKAFKAHPDFHPAIDADAVALLMRHNCIPAPYSIYRDVKKLPPATLLHIDQASSAGEPQAYWSLRSAVDQGRSNPFSGTDAAATDRLEDLLDGAIALQRVADVPLGAFLSGGVDSSLIVALMQRQSATAVRTFTIGFEDPRFDEAMHARAVARHLGTDHTELYVSGQQALDIVPRMPTLYCEPFADSSQVPTFLVAEMARRHVTVSLSGDAGDELFGGYARYATARGLWSRISKVPWAVRAMAGPAIRAVPPQWWDQAGRVANGVLRRGPLTERFGDRAHKLAGMLRASSREAFYREMNSHEPRPEHLVLGSREPPTVMNQEAQWPVQDSFEERMMFIDQMGYLPDDILVKVDRAAMGASLETRVPLLDHRVIEFAWSLPLHLKRRNGIGKWLLRELLYRHVPRQLIERPKTGFAVPLSAWLRGPLRAWAESLLDERRLREQGLLDVAYVRRLWSEQLSGQREWKYLLWNVLMFQAWLESQ